MKYMRMLGLEEISPLGALVAGTLLGVAGVPVIRKTARGIAVVAVGAVLSASDYVRDIGGNMSGEWRSLLEDARTRRAEAGVSVGDQIREAGVGLAGAGLAVADMAREKYRDVKESVEQKIARAGEAAHEAGEEITESVDDADGENTFAVIHKTDDL